MSEMEHSNTEGAQELGEGQSDARDYEFEARQLGWKDPSDPDYKGDRTKALSAQEFVEKSSGKVPLLEADRKKLLSRIAEMEKKFIKHAKTMEEYERAGYEKAMAEINAKQRAAVEVGDVEAFDAAQKERDKLEKKAKTEDKPDPDREEKFIEWQADNPWFGKEEALTRFADLQGQKILQESGKAQLDDDDLDEIASRVKARFSDKFPALFGIVKEEDKEEAPARKSAVGGVTPARGKTVRSAADLDSRARQVGESMVRMGIYKDLNEYAKELHA